MLIIADIRMPLAAKARLMLDGEVLWLEPQKPIYEAIAAHPDIFFCESNRKLIASPNIPEAWKQKLQNAGIEPLFGTSFPGSTYPQTAVFNAVVTETLLVHHLKITDPVLLATMPVSKHLHTQQGYARCNLFPLSADCYITGDRDIYNRLRNLKMEVVWVESRQIQLPGFRNGFVGGCFGRYGNKVYFCGNLDDLTEAKAIREALDQHHLELVNLFEGPPTDVGSIFFIDFD